MNSVSVVMAVYNGRRFLGEQVVSLLADLRPQDEVIVVDDASTDDSAEWISSLDDRRIQLVRNASNQGVKRSFDLALSRASHEIIFLCDQDDVWLRGKRDRVLAEFKRDDRVVAVVSDAQVIDEYGRVQRQTFMSGRDGFRGGLIATLWKNRYLGCAMALRRSVLKQALPIPPKAPMHDMWLGAIATLQGRVSYVDVALIQYRRHGGNLSPSRRSGWVQVVRWRWQLLSALTTRWLAMSTGRR